MWGEGSKAASGASNAAPSLLSLHLLHAFLHKPAMQHRSSEPWWLEGQHGRWSSARHSSRRAESGRYGEAQTGIRDPGGNAAWGHVLAGLHCLWQMLQPFTVFQTLRPNAVCSHRISGSLETLWKLVRTETLKSHQFAKFSSFIFSQSFSPRYPGSYYWFCRPLLCHHSPPCIQVGWG